ncbi:MAG: MFS transporter [Burkholderiaceae bacterium]|nr:MAG: MFS transporter [Burkholderiaceae bacterium]
MATATQEQQPAPGSVGSSAATLADQPARRFLVFVIIALALIMVAIDSTIVSTALDALQKGLDTTINWAGWTLTAYAFGLTLMLPISGKLGERYGGRRVFIGSVLVFTLASLLCGLTSNIYVLIVLRVLQAAGGAGFTPAATGIIVDHFGNARDRAVSLFGTMFPIGAMIGPIFGGFFVTYWSWRAVFFVNVPIGLAILALAFHYIPHDRHKTRERRSMDLPGLALLGACILCAMLAVNFLAEPGVHLWSPRFVIPALVALASGPLFWRHITRSAQPFILPRLLSESKFSSVNLINAIFGGVTIGSVALIPLYAINRYGMNALQSGSLLIAQGIGTIVISIVAVALLRRTGYRRPLYLGGSLIGLGFLLVALPPVGGVSPYAWLVIGALVVGAGNGIANPASRNAGLQLAPQHSATLAALRTLFIQFGSIATISIATAILASVAHPASAQPWIYVAAALVYLAAIPAVMKVPEHHGAW